MLIDQDKCRGWRMCVSGCPYKKIYYNWSTGKAEKCIFCYPRIEAGQPTVCSETCVGRIRYLGVLLYDADRIEAAASVEDPKALYQAQLDVFLDPHDPAVIAQARADGVPEAWLKAATESPVYKMAMEWKVALPLHPEYRTLPMVWYVPPLSPISAASNAGDIGAFGELPDVRSLRIPVQYLANLLTAGDEAPVVAALERMLAMRAYMRDRHVEQRENAAVLKQVGLTALQVEEMYRYMAIANYEDRFVIPTAHREYAENAFDVRGGCGFSFGNGCSDGQSEGGLFGGKKKKTIPITVKIAGARGMTMTITYKALSALLAYPSADLIAALPDIAAIIERERRLGRPQKEALRALVAGLATSDLLDLQEAYVALFDRGRATSLHLFEHVHGDSRERGQAMVDLKEIYARNGFVLAGSELPDFLPAVLEYLAQRPEAEAKDMLGDCAHILRAVGEALQDRASDYSAIFAATLAMVGEPGLAARRRTSRW